MAASLPRATRDAAWMRATAPPTSFWRFPGLIRRRRRRKCRQGDSFGFSQYTGSVSGDDGRFVITSFASAGVRLAEKKTKVSTGASNGINC